MRAFLDDAQSLFEITRDLRRDFHRHPELGFQEVRTAGIVARELTSLGLEVASGVGRTGVVGLLEGARPGPTVLVRFDMDALPIQEETGAVYASQAPGVMHACGHDAHTSIGLTVARLLTARRDTLPGRIKFVFQPAEEGLGGAEAMIADGVLRDPAPDAVLALHVWNERPVGWLALVPGPLMAGGEYFTIRIAGRGGHGALPHLTADPIAAAAQVISALQTVVARNVSPLEAAVISVTRIQAGETFNVIPPAAELLGTIRAFDPAVRETVIARVQAVVTGVAEAMGCRVEITIDELTPAVVNDPAVAARLQRIAPQVLPGIQVDTTFRTMVSEDMAFMMQGRPGCYVMIGSANAERGLNAGHHTPQFDIDERVLPQGAAFMAAAVVELLEGEGG